MSELKARTARSIADEEEILELGADCPIEPAQVYLKSEADKVIAEKDAEIAKLKALATEPSLSNRICRKCGKEGTLMYMPTVEDNHTFWDLYNNKGIDYVYNIRCAHCGEVAFVTKQAHDYELKTKELEKDKEIAEKDEKIRRLRKALLLVCAKRADAEARIEHYLADLLLKGQTCKSVDFHRLERDKWYQRAVSCRAKAEDYRGGSANRLPSSFPVRVKEVKRILKVATTSIVPK